VEAKL